MGNPPDLRRKKHMHRGSARQVASRQPFVGTALHRLDSSVESPIYVGNRRTGLQILWRQCEPTADVDSGPLLPGTISRVFPNPFREIASIRCSIERAQTAGALRILDAGGRVVRTPPIGAGERGVGEVRWTGTDDAGRRLAPGVYFCRYGYSGRSTTQKLIRLE